MFFSIRAAAVILAAVVSSVVAETHTITFTNNCGFGTPRLIQGPNTLSTGGTFTINGPLHGAIAYLQTGGCGFNGEGCTIVETTLVNPSTAGSGSSTDLSLIPPHAFSVTTGFGYFNGCDRAGADCTNGNCNTAFHVSTDTFVQVACQTDNVNLAITFCL
ncbi:glycopeptide [Mycena vulgaris]|nr:glycopeptide [Mycena vulgaris]